MALPRAKGGIPTPDSTPKGRHDFAASPAVVAGHPGDHSQHHPTSCPMIPASAGGRAMTVAELLNLPVGARLHWHPPDGTPGGDSGAVTAREAATVVVTWDRNGDEAAFSPDDEPEDLFVVAEWAERVDVADVPVIIDSPAG
jgi:hypothetical protein